MDAELTEMVRGTFRALLASTDAARVPAACTEAGLSELLADRTLNAWMILFEEQGSLGLATPALDLSLQWAVGLPLKPELAVVWPMPARSLDPSSRVIGAALELDGVLLPGADRASALLVPALRDDAVVVVEVPRADVEISALGGIDPGLGLVEAHARLSAPTAAAEVPWLDAVAVVQRCIAHELIGGARTSLDVACAHVVGRHQFGKPIAAFQSVKHRLAEALVARTAAEHAVSAAWSDEDPCVTWGAKALAARAATIAGQHGQQVCGATGYLADHPVQQLLRRALVLDAFLGPEGWLRTEIGRQIITRRSVPLVPSIDRHMSTTCE